MKILPELHQPYIANSPVVDDAGRTCPTGTVVTFLGATVSNNDSYIVEWVSLLCSGRVHHGTYVWDCLTSNKFELFNISESEDVRKEMEQIWQSLKKIQQQRLPNSTNL